MKPLQKDIEITSALGGERIAMSLDEKSLTHLMNMFIDLYKDQQMAVLREYSTNARDSHVAAGNKAPIEITLPVESVLGDAPVLRIKDFGVGMNRDDIVETYSRYGASTKRESDDYNGTLGVGCKAGLTYTPQFTLVGIKDGVSTTVVISRDETGAGSMTIVDEHETDQPNGVEVIIPVKKHNEFADKAAYLFSVWDEGTVLVDGEAPARIEGLPIGDGGDMIVVQGGDKHIVVMGGVPYPFKPHTSLNYDYSIVAWVDVGSLAFENSREGLLEDEAINKATIATIEEYFENHVADAVQIEIDKADNPTDAVRTLVKWQRIATNLPHTMVWRGKDLPRQVKLPEGGGVTSYDSYKLSAFDRQGVVPIESWPKTMFVTGWDPHTFTPAMKKKLKQYVKDTEGEYAPRIFALVKGKGIPKDVAKWIDTKTQVVKWEKIAAIKLPRNYSTGGGIIKTIPGSYFVRSAELHTKHGVGGSVEVAGKEIDQTNSIYYTVDRSNAHTLFKALVRHDPDCTLVELTSNRVAKFERTLPEAVEARKALGGFFKEWKKTITPKQMRALSLSRLDRETYEAIEAAQVHDPAIRQMVYALKLDVEKLDETARRWRNLGFHFDMDVPDPLEKYPLFDSDHLTGSYYNTKEEMKVRRAHTYAYLNAAYDAGLAV